eukprot:COSAG01_NODE_965_length_12401_cov_3.496098_4_plen_238_part_00
MAGCKRTAYHWCNVSGRYPPGCNQTANPFCNVSLGSLDYTPHPNRSIEGNTIVAWPEKEDSAAAYTHALLWYITQDERHAAKSIEIMDAWSTTFRHQSDSSGKSAGLVAGWTGAVWPRAAEIIKHTTPPSLWHATSVARFERMLNTVYLPLVNRGSDTNGWSGVPALCICDSPTYAQLIHGCGLVCNLWGGGATRELGAGNDGGCVPHRGVHRQRHHRGSCSAAVEGPGTRLPVPCT